MHRFFSLALSQTARRVGALAVSCLAAASMVACGGGTQSKKFKPDSFVAFGDDFALIKSDGSRYTVNTYRDGYTPSTTPPATPSSPPVYSCNAELSWLMLFAFDFGFKFSTECPDWSSGGDKTAVMLANDPVDISFTSTGVDTAVANAGANAVLTTINQNLSLLNKGTLVTVTVGRADIVKAYWTYLLTPDDATLSSLKSQLKSLGGSFAAGLQPVVQSGARTMIVLTPSLAESPLAKLDAVNVTRNKAAMAALVQAFNDGLTFGLSTSGYTGQQVALVDVPTVLNAVLTNPSAYGLASIDSGACSTVTTSNSFGPPPLCLATDLPDQTVLTSYFWADNTHVNTSMASTIASTAYSAFSNHPF
ncbi:MAG: hypothetical protein KGI91_14955 [Burkholderiales bacterium]|nr:hypothetical protein [Burkholderiales bacterium]MDE2433967.1 hypothetical protein [Burkholderiales bacterium]